MLIDDMSDPSRWRFVSDRVMGGVSVGQAQGAHHREAIPLEQRPDLFIVPHAVNLAGDAADLLLRRVELSVDASIGIPVPLRVQEIDLGHEGRRLGGQCGRCGKAHGQAAHRHAKRFAPRNSRNILHHHRLLSLAICEQVAG